jgi:hypothetical protein
MPGLSRDLPVRSRPLRHDETSLLGPRVLVIDHCDALRHPLENLKSAVLIGRAGSNPALGTKLIHT